MGNVEYNRIRASKKMEIKNTDVFNVFVIGLIFENNTEILYKSIIRLNYRVYRTRVGVYIFF